jgi:hypothetical protein
MLWYKVKKAQLKLFCAKASKEIKKLAVAVVVTEYILGGLYCYTASQNYFGLFDSKTVQVYVMETVKDNTAKVEAKDNVSVLLETIYKNESSNSKHCLQRCANIGKVNCIGYDIKNTCFDNQDEEKQTLTVWIKSHIAQGLTNEELLSHYSGGDYTK